MALYQIFINKGVIKALAKIDEPYYSKIKQAIYRLANNPRPQGYIKLKGRDAFRIRVANYRIIYEIFNDTLIIDVVDLGHRKDIYK